jgi:hydroxymethylpyrimidine/phosphomethylpyrimidine kinase
VKFISRQIEDYRKPSILSIAGLDPSGCAGLLLDVRVIRALGFHPCGVVTAITFQNTCSGYGFDEVSYPTLESQFRSVFEDELVMGVKLGLLTSKAAEAAFTFLRGGDFFSVWDPVFSSTTGLKFFENEYLRVTEKITATVDIITPNVEEAELLSGIKIVDILSAERAAERIYSRYGVQTIITGGKLSGKDLIYDGKKTYTVEAEFSPVEIRGTGCVYSTALTCFLTRGEKIRDAARLARLYLLESVKRAGLYGKCLPCSDPPPYYNI